MLSPSERSLRGRIGAFALHSRHDPKVTTAAGRATFLAKFYDGIPEDLPVEERERRALAARREHFARLAYKSARSRSRKAA